MALGANRTDLIGDPSRQPGQLPADTQGQATAREEASVGMNIPTPGARGPLARPSERPSEPVSAGLSVGPGSGPVSGDLRPIDRVRAAYAKLPSESLRRLLEVMERAEPR